MLGTALPIDALTSAGLDSQNRFYGVVFTLYGVLLLLAARDLLRYSVILRYAFWLTFFGGLARLLSIAVHGLPPPFIILLLITELVIPPPMIIWLGKVLAAEPASVQRSRATY